MKTVRPDAVGVGAMAVQISWVQSHIIVAQRDFSYSETQALGKQDEEALLYRDLEEDVVQQLLRRLSSIKSLNSAV